MRPLTLEKSLPMDYLHSDVGHQMAHKGSVVRQAETRDIGHDLICIIRHKTLKTSTLQAADEVVAVRRTPVRVAGNRCRAAAERARRPAGAGRRRPPRENRELSGWRSDWSS